MTKFSDKAFSVVLEEYRQLRQELLLTMNSTRGVVQFVIFASASLAAASNLIVTYKQYTVFLFFPIGFMILHLIFLRYMMLHIELVIYIRDVTVPLIDMILKSEDGYSSAISNNMLLWQINEATSSPFSSYRAFLYPIPASPLFLSFGVSLFSMVMFFGSHEITSISLLQKSIIFLDTILMIYCSIASVIIGVRARSIYRNRSKLRFFSTIP
mgnify:CR=1 FL=1